MAPNFTSECRRAARAADRDGSFGGRAPTPRAQRAARIDDADRRNAFDRAVPSLFDIDDRTGGGSSSRTPTASSKTAHDASAATAAARRSRHRLVNGSRGVAGGSGRRRMRISGMRSSRSGATKRAGRRTAPPPEWPEVRFKSGRTKLIVPTSASRRSLPAGTIIRLQIPLALAWALTIHKSQGQSLDPVICNIGRLLREPGQATSRSAARSTSRDCRSPASTRTASSPRDRQGFLPPPQGRHAEAVIASRHVPLWWRGDSSTNPLALAATRARCGAVPQRRQSRLDLPAGRRLECFRRWEQEHPPSTDDGGRARSLPDRRRRLPAAAAQPVPAAAARRGSTRAAAASTAVPPPAAGRRRRSRPAAPPSAAGRAVAAVAGASRPADGVVQVGLHAVPPRQAGRVPTGPPVGLVLPRVRVCGPSRHPARAGRTLCGVRDALAAVPRAGAVKRVREYVKVKYIDEQEPVNGWMGVCGEGFSFSL